MQHILRMRNRMHKDKIIVRTQDNHQIAVTVFEPEKHTKAHIHILHGMAEHQERYVPFAQCLTEVGYLVSMHDHRGHGQTAKLNQIPNGFFSDKDGFDKVVKDVKTVTDIVRENLTLPPMILFGHSMGSFVARKYTQLYSEELSKVIYSGTGGVSFQHYVGVFLAKLLAKTYGKTVESKIMDYLSFGHFNHSIQNPKTKFDWLSSDSKEVERYIADDQCGYVSTNQFYVDFLQGIITLSKDRKVRQIRNDLPILLISGADDPVGGYGKGIWKVANQFSRCGLHDITVHLFEDMRHEILNEINREQVVQTILKWLEKK